MYDEEDENEPDEIGYQSRVDGIDYILCFECADTDEFAGTEESVIYYDPTEYLYCENCDEPLAVYEKLYEEDHPINLPTPQAPQSPPHRGHLVLEGLHQVLVRLGRKAR